jgi:tetratricopeptide (TPR) repeat protein
MRIAVISLFVGGLVLMFASGCGNPEPTVIEGPRNLDSLIVKYPDSVGLLLERGNNFYDKLSYDLAMVDAAKAFRLDSSNIEARLLYAGALNNRATRSLEDVAMAQYHYMHIVKKQPKNVKALVGLAATFAFQQDFKKTFQYVNEALRINPKYRDAYVLKGTTYRIIGNMDLAKSSYETAVQQDPEFVAAYFALGQMYQAENNPVCVEYFTTAHTLKPEFLEAKYQLAFSKQMFGQIEEARNIYRSMATDTIDFYVARALFHQGHIKQFEDKEIDSAMYFYRSSLETEPALVESWHNLGTCYEGKGDVTRALQSYAKALALNPEFELSREAADRLK